MCVLGFFFFWLLQDETVRFCGLYFKRFYGSYHKRFHGSTVFLILWRFDSVVEVNFPIIGGSYFQSHTTVNCHFPPRCRRLTSKMKASQEVVLLGGILPCCCWSSWYFLGGVPLVVLLGGFFFLGGFPW